MSFDLHDVSEKDYTKFYNALAKIGLTHWVKGNIGKLELPHSAVIGDFTGISVKMCEIGSEFRCFKFLRQRG